MSRVYCFSNYLEWSRVTEDDIEDPGDNGTLYLTTNFFDQRQKGWSELTPSIKKGTTVGYVFNGTAYSIEDREMVRNITYDTVYRSIIKGKQTFRKLQEIHNIQQSN